MLPISGIFSFNIFQVPLLCCWAQAVLLPSPCPFLGALLSPHPCGTQLMCAALGCGIQVV